MHLGGSSQGLRALLSWGLSSIGLAVRQRRKLLSDVAEYGWHVIFVNEEPVSPKVPGASQEGTRES